MEVPTTPLVDAVEAGDQESVIRMMHDGVSLSPVDNFGIYPPLLACNLGRGAVLKVLLELKAPIHFIDKEGLMPLHRAARAGFSDVVEVQLDMHDGKVGAGSENQVDVPCTKDGLTPQQYACKNCQYGTASVLLAAGASMNRLDKAGNTLLHQCCDFPNSDLIEKLLSHNNGRGMITAQNMAGETPLHYCAYRNEAHLCEQFLRQFAVPAHFSVDVEMYQKNQQDASLEDLHRALESVDGRGLTPTLAAAKLGFLNLMQALFNCGHNQLVQTQFPSNLTAIETQATCVRGDTLLHLLVRTRAPQSVLKPILKTIALTNQRAALCTPNELKNTPLDLCVLRRLDEPLALLLPYCRDLILPRNFVNFVIQHGNKFIDQVQFSELGRCLETGIDTRMLDHFYATTRQEHTVLIFAILASNWEFFNRALNFVHHFEAKVPAHIRIGAHNGHGDTIFDALLLLCSDTHQLQHIFAVLQRGEELRTPTYSVHTQYKLKFFVSLSSLLQLSSTALLLRVLRLLDDHGCQQRAEAVSKYLLMEENDCPLRDLKPFEGTFTVEDYRVLLGSHRECTPFILWKRNVTTSSNVLAPTGSSSSTSTVGDITLTQLAVLDDTEITSDATTVSMQLAIRPAHVMCLLGYFAPVSLPEVLLLKDSLLAQLYCRKAPPQAQEPARQQLLRSLSSVQTDCVTTLNTLLTHNQHANMERTVLHLVLAVKHIAYTLPILHALQDSSLDSQVSKLLSLISIYTSNLSTSSPNTSLFAVTKATYDLSKTYMSHLGPVVHHLDRLPVSPPTPEYSYVLSILLRWTDTHIAPILCK